MTIFSASNYCNEFDNAGAMMCVSADMICTFVIIKVQPSPTQSQHPLSLPSVLSPRVDALMSSLLVLVMPHTFHDYWH